MRQFTIKSAGPDPSVLELLDETEGGYHVRIVHRHEEWEDVREEFLSRDLFDTCLRTGYLTALSA